MMVVCRRRCAVGGASVLTEVVVVVVLHLFGGGSEDLVSGEDELEQGFTVGILVGVELQCLLSVSGADLVLARHAVDAEKLIVIPLLAHSFSFFVDSLCCRFQLFPACDLMTFL